MSCLPTGTSFLSSNLIDLRNFYEKGSRLYPDDSVMGQIENVGRYITVVPAHAITAFIIAPITFIYDISIAFLTLQTAAESDYMDQQFRIFCVSSIRDIGYLISHAVASVFPCCIYQTYDLL